MCLENQFQMGIDEMFAWLSYILFSSSFWEKKGGTMSVVSKIPCQDFCFLITCINLKKCWEMMPLIFSIQAKNSLFSCPNLVICHKFGFLCIRADSRFLSCGGCFKRNWMGSLALAYSTTIMLRCLITTWWNLDLCNCRQSSYNVSSSNLGWRGWRPLPEYW